MHKRTLFLIIVSFLFIFQISFAQTDNSIATQKFSVDALKKDFQTWRNTLEKSHANLYLYTSKERLDIVLDSMYQNITQPMTALEFYAYITPLVAIIKDGHNYVHPSDALMEYYNKHELFFPFHVTYLDKKLLIDMNLSADSTIAAGSEILNINGVSSEKIWNELIRRQPRDGNNETYPTWILNNWFREYYSYVFGHPTIFDLEIKTSQNNSYKVNVAARNKDTIYSIRKTKYPERTFANDYEKPIEWKQLSTNKTAILAIKTFSGKVKKKYHQPFKKTLKQAFNEFKNNQTENIILDLRDNQGGSQMYGIALVSYFLDQPFQFSNEIYGVKKGLASDEKDRLKQKSSHLTKLHKPKKQHFTGNVYVLINGGSFSASAMVSTCLQVNKRAVFIGEETGGNSTVLTGTFMAKTKTTLPNTQIICDKPDYKIIYKDILLNDGHGVYPEYRVQPTIQDIIDNKDVALNYALEMIRKK